MGGWGDSQSPGAGGLDSQPPGAGGLDSQPPKIGGWVLAPSSPQPPRKNHMFVGGVFRNPGSCQKRHFCQDYDFNKEKIKKRLRGLNREVPGAYACVRAYARAYARVCARFFF